jgi:hypothetical protein
LAAPIPAFAGFVAKRLLPAAGALKLGLHHQQEIIVLQNILSSAVLAAMVCGGAARADVVTDWNQTALKAANVAGFGGPPETRLLAMVNAAMYDAVNSVDRRHEVYAVDVQAPPGASMEAAGASAAHAILTRALPVQKSIFDAALAASLVPIADGPSRAAGIAVGEQVGAKLFDARKDDGAGRKPEYSYGSGPGVYQRTAPANAAMPAAAQWGTVRPFMLKSASQFALPGPPALRSAQFARDYEEVKRYGSKNSTLRTSQQTASAVFWAQSEMVPYTAAAKAAGDLRKNSVVDNARLYTYLSMAAADALIAGFQIKYQQNFWRPITAIRAGAVAANPKLAADANWEPLITTPPHPEYPSAHCLASGAMEKVLQTFFGSDKVDVTLVFPAPGILRRYESFSQMSREVTDARVWSGIHYRTADEHGMQLGRKVAEYGMANFLRPLTQ